MDRLRLRPRHGPPRHDLVRHSRHPSLRAERSAVSSPVRMKFSVNWLTEFVDLPTNAEELAELLTGAGVETENIERRGAKIDKVIVSPGMALSHQRNADFLTASGVDFH